jgi:type IV pilus assembly protein PilB
VQINVKADMTFAAALRSILRSDPDVIMVGEIRDPETAKMAIESALTGHFVLSTLHTNDAPGALTRLNEMGVEPFLTGSAVSPYSPSASPASSARTAARCTRRRRRS